MLRHGRRPGATRSRRNVTGEMVAGYEYFLVSVLIDWQFDVVSTKFFFGKFGFATVCGRYDQVKTVDGCRSAMPFCGWNNPAFTTRCGSLEVDLLSSKYSS